MSKNQHDFGSKSVPKNQHELHVINNCICKLWESKPQLKCYVWSRSGFIRGPFGFLSGSVRDPFGVRSEWVRGPFGVHSRSVRYLFGTRRSQKKTQPRVWLGGGLVAAPLPTADTIRFSVFLVQTRFPYNWGLLSQSLQMQLLITCSSC